MRLAAVVRALLVVAALAAVLAARPDLLAAAARSPLAWLAAGSVIGLAVLTRLAVARLLHRPGLAPWTATAVVLTCLALLIGPSLHETTLVEAFPTATEPSATGQAAVPTVPAPSVPAPTVPAPTVTTNRSPATAGTATRLTSGRLHGIDHGASGGLALYRVGEQVVLRFEGVNIQGTPGPSVRLVPRGGRTPSGGLRLGALKAEHGNFSYRLPAGFNAASTWSVLVWCDPYNTPVAAGDLR